MTNTSNNLTVSQQQAVDHVDGPLLVLAAPGSRKTRVITFRIANLLKHGVRPDQILALTFTNKAAREMAERVQHLLGGIKVRVSTFHRFCSRILRRWPERVGVKENFPILHQSDQPSVVRRVMKDLDLDTQIHEPGRVLSRISRARNDMVTSELFRNQFEQRAGSPLDAVVYQVFPEYERRVQQQNAVDFDDLLLHVVTMLEEDEALREALDDQFRYILVDEYQHTNLAQSRIVHAMSLLYRNLELTHHTLLVCTKLSYTHENHYLTAKQVIDLFTLTREAHKDKRPLTRFITIHLKDIKDLKIKTAQNLVSNIMEKTRKWLQRNGFDHAHIWVLENGDVKDIHAHILVHIPNHHTHEYKRLLKKWLSLKATDNPLDIKPITYPQWGQLGTRSRVYGVLRYMCKGLDPKTPTQGIRPEYQGEIARPSACAGAGVAGCAGSVAGPRAD